MVKTAYSKGSLLALNGVQSSEELLTYILCHREQRGKMRALGLYTQPSI